MANLCVTSALCQCSFGTTPSPLMAGGTAKVLGLNLPAATIQDLPKLPFGTCSCPTNPAVISAGGAPVPCVPAVTAPWSPGATTVLIGGTPALDSTSKAICTNGGVIQIIMTPCVTVEIP